MDLGSVRSLGYRTDLALLQRSGSTVVDRGDHLVIRTDDNPTFRWGNYLLLRAAPAPASTAGWTRRFEAEFPRATHRAFGVDDPKPGVADLSLFAEAGYDVEADAVMTTRSVRPPARPDREATYRILVSESDWTQGLDLTLSGRPDENARERDRPYTTARVRAHRRLAESGDGSWYGAFLGDRLVAQLGLVSATAGLARFQDVETHPDFRQRGLAATLDHHASGHGLGALGAHTLVTVADPGYPAIRIYRALGFTESEHQLGASRVPTS